VRVWGLHVIDVAILVSFLVAILAIGMSVSRGVKKQSDFYLGGRSLGRALQFFLNFGNATDSNSAVVMASEVYRQGVGGVWLSLQTLFITPFFWFTQPWYRRARVITMGDLFVDRFDSKAVAFAYAAFNVGVALLLLGIGNLGTYEVAAAMTHKPESAWSARDRASIEGFRELRSLQKARDAEKLTAVQTSRTDELENQLKRGELSASVSYIKPIPFFIAYSAIVGAYIMLGGLKAAAITDAIQGILILIMSVVLIPVGLAKIGGVHQLHMRVPSEKLELFGTAAMSEYTWYSIAAITLGSFVQIIGLSHNMSSGGSARDEDIARFGMISGGFTKRIVLIAWMFCGLLAIAILFPSLSNPDQAWGALSESLLPVGLMGLMLSGMLLGHMPSVGLSSVAVSGLVTRNIYQPLVPDREPQHYLRVGQVFIAVVLATSILISMAASGVASLMKTLITFNTFFGAAVFLTFFWRRLTAPAILISCALWVLLIGILPILVPAAPGLRRMPSLVLENKGSTACFFEKVASIDPTRPELGKEGIGRFFTENYLLNLIGVPMERFSAAGLVAARWLFDAIFPFVLLIVFSWMTPRGDAARAARFYARMKTPVGKTPEEDRAEVETSHANPSRFDQLKLFPGTNWEFTKWTGKDFVGFFGCWGIVGVILVLLWMVLHVGA
jgi:solute:Na+ symporter, SSS family